MSRKQEYRILELESENRTLRVEIEQLKKINLIYSESNFSTLDLGGELLSPFVKQAGDEIDMNNTVDE